MRKLLLGLLACIVFSSAAAAQHVTPVPCTSRPVSSTIPLGSAVALVNVTPKTVTSIEVTPGTWDISTNPWVTTGGTLIYVEGGFSLTTNTMPTRGTGQSFLWSGSSTSPVAYSTGDVRLTFAATTTLFLVVEAGFSVSGGGFGFIQARSVC